MKIIGKQIVVELPERKDSVLAILDKSGKRYYEQKKLADGSWNEALSEVAMMNPAWEVDEDRLTALLTEWRDDGVLSYTANIAHALTSNPSAWMKRKDSDEAKAEPR